MNLLYRRFLSIRMFILIPLWVPLFKMPYHDTGSTNIKMPLFMEMLRLGMGNQTGIRVLMEMRIIIMHLFFR